MYCFRITSYKNGNLEWMADDVKSYPTRSEAVAAAQYAADYWHLLHGRNDGELQRTESGAIRWYKDADGNRYRREYKVVNPQ